jgi:hypothetical protein
MTRHEKQKRKKEQNKRSEIEGKFGQAKSKYGLDDIKTKRQDISMACIALILMALNAIKLGRAFLCLFYGRAAALTSNLGRQLILNPAQGCNQVLSRTQNLIILHRLAPAALTF